MGIIQFDIRHPNGQRERAVVEGQRALIGSGAHCDVRLPVDQSAYEHVLIEAVGSTLRAEAKSQQPPATLDGLELVASAVPADAVLGVGDTRLYVSFVADAFDSPQVARKQSGTSPLLALALIPVFGALTYLLFWDNTGKIAPPPAQIQPLFSEAQVACPQQDPTRALAFAEEQLEVAEGKHERLPFAIEDGVLAVGLYRLAASCFRSGGDAARAGDTERTATLLEQELSDEYRARRLRLSHLLSVEDYEPAAKDVTVLRALTGERKGRYFDWLSEVAEQLKTKGVQ